MRRKKYVMISVSSIEDNRINDAEFRFLARICAIYGKSGFRAAEETINHLKMSKSTFYRLLNGLVKHGYLNRNLDDGSYQVAITDIDPE